MRPIGSEMTYIVDFAIVRLLKTLVIWLTPVTSVMWPMWLIRCGCSDVTNATDPNQYYSYRLILQQSDLGYVKMILVAKLRFLLALFGIWTFDHLVCWRVLSSASAFWKKFSRFIGSFVPQFVHLIVQKVLYNFNFSNCQAWNIFTCRR